MIINLNISVNRIKMKLTIALLSFSSFSTLFSLLLKSTISVADDSIVYLLSQSKISFILFLISLSLNLKKMYLTVFFYTMCNTFITISYINFLPKSHKEKSKFVLRGISL